MSRVLVSGAFGYKGSVLVPKLLAAGHEVTGVDTLWFGNNLPPHPLLHVVQQDIRAGVDCTGQDAVIHLAGIANDPCGELDAKLTWEVNVYGTLRLADNAARAGVKQFIFASSASVYGLKDNRPVIETDTFEPVSDYNKTKASAERVLLSYAGDMAIQIARPATVCGMSPRMRLDTMVNMLTAQALANGTITAHCGEHGAGLMRPNVHIEDVTNLYMFLLANPKLTGCYNVGNDNISALDTAKLIAEEIPARIEITTVVDKRSYAVDSSKLLATGFKFTHSVRDAIREIVKASRAGQFADDRRARNLWWMQDNGLVAA